MKNEMFGWKVLNDCRGSVSGWSNVNPIALYYPVNEEVFPKIPKAKLFFFERKSHAETFAVEALMHVMIVPCIATHPIKVIFFRICSTLRDIENFWEGRQCTHSDMSCPEGTWLADSITCLE